MPPRYLKVIREESSFVWSNQSNFIFNCEGCTLVLPDRFATSDGVRSID